MSQLDLFGSPPSPPTPTGPRVFNCRKGAKPTPPPGAVYVGRPSRWGNPFKLEGEAERGTVLARYEAWVRSQPDLMQAMREELRGKDLVCWCAPRSCHADIILRIANESP